MKIAMISIHSCPIGELGTRDTGGMSVYIRELAKELGKRGHRVDIYTRYHGEGHEPVMQLTENVRLLHIRAGGCEDMHKLAVYPYVRDFAEELDRIRHIDNLRYDLIHNHYWLSGLVGNYLARWWRIPQVTMFHTLGAVKNTLNIGEPEPECRICSERALVHAGGMIIAPTAKEKHEIVRYYGADPQTVRVIPCGVNQKLFQRVKREKARNRLGIGMDEHVLLYVGRVEPLKGIDRLIRTMAWLKKRIDVKLLIVGGDDTGHPRMQQMRTLVRKLDLEKCVEFAGRADQEDLPGFYSAADALVVASLYESFGLVALEAMSCGTPVVSTAVGGMRSIVRQGVTGCLIGDDTVTGMAQSILHILDHPELYSHRARAIRNSILRFSWENIAASMADAYKDLISGYSHRFYGKQRRRFCLDWASNG
ncbi:MAG: glycosyltransferase [Desulfobacterales bacterium]